jgi:3-deoxy-7-phosphoheptulonate synthase
VTPNHPPRGGRISAHRTLPSPDHVRRSLPLATAGAATVDGSRHAVASVLRGLDDRLLVVVGPCSIHDPVAGLRYAERLAEVADVLADHLCVIMRAYVEKPRTGLGWRGLVSDPDLDGSGRAEQGIPAARQFLLDVVALGLPVGCEFVDPVTSAYLADLVSWGAVGARTAASPVHRQMASCLPMPVGFKNAVDGDIRLAVDAALAASTPQAVLGIDGGGRVGVGDSTGNPDVHLVLRGGSTGPNHASPHVAEAGRLLRRVGLPDRVVIDASHGNSAKDHREQARVAVSVVERVAGDEPGIAGIMLESFLVAGSQPLGDGPVGPLTFGQSVTDACLGWEETRTVLERLAVASQRRRGARERRIMVHC